MSKARQTEEDHQRALATWLDLRGQLWCHVPNGGQRPRGGAGKMKGQGVKPGVPDVLIFDPTRDGQKGLAIELKLPAQPRRKKGRLSPEQRAWLEGLRRRGWAAHVAYGWGEASHLVEQYYGPGGGA